MLTTASLKEGWPWLWLQVRRDIALAGGKLVILEVVVGVNVIALVHLVVPGLDAVSISTTMRGAGDGILHIFIAISVKIMLIITVITCSILPRPSPPPPSSSTMDRNTDDADDGCRPDGC